MTILIIIIAAVLLDRCLGEPRRWHPLVLFGAMAAAIERSCYGISTGSTALQKWRGLTALTIAVLPATLFFNWLAGSLSGGWLFELFGLYLCLGRQSLAEHARAIAAPLLRGDIHQARIKVGYIVSRNTDRLSETEISKATVESVLENGNDACFATLFWFVVAGLPGALLHRLVNTLDAMWGYRNDRYQHFGWAAAKLDDLLAWLPARLCALSYALVGTTASAFLCWRTQAKTFDSPNGGPVMAAGAGALEVELGGDARYDDQLKHRPILGCGKPADATDIERAIQLVNRALMLWLFAIFALLFVMAG